MAHGSDLLKYGNVKRTWITKNAKKHAAAKTLINIEDWMIPTLPYVDICIADLH